MDRKNSRNWKDILRLSICDYLDFDNIFVIMVILYVNITLHSLVKMSLILGPHNIYYR